MKTLLLKKRPMVLLMIMAFCYNATTAQSSPDSSMQNFTLAFQSLDGSNTTRELQLSFSETTSDGFDEGYEIKNLEVLADDLNLILNDELMSAQAYGPINEDKVVPLVLESTGNYNFTIGLVTMENMGSQSIRLRDNFTGEYFDLRSYEAFEFSSDAGTFLDRFEVFFKSTTLSQTDIEIEQMDIRYISGTNTIAVANPNHRAVKRMEVFNISSQKVYTNGIVHNTPSINYQVGPLVTGVYIIRLVTEGNTSITQKLFIR